MIGFIEQAALQFEGLSEEDIKALDGILPDIQKLDKALIENWPAISKVAGVLLPIVEKVLAKQQGVKA